MSVYRVGDRKGSSGMFEGSYEVEKARLPCLVWQDAEHDISAIYIPTNLQSLASNKTYCQKLSANLCENSRVALNGSVDEAAAFRHFYYYQGEPVISYFVSKGHFKISTEVLGITDVYSAIKYLSKLPRTTISQDHHIHYTAVHAGNMFKNKYGDKLFIDTVSDISTMCDITMTAAAGILMYIVLLPKCVAIAMLKAGLVRGYESMNEWYSERKKFSNDFKLNANTSVHRLEQFFEIEVLVNRLELSVDWETEKNNRINVNIASFEPGVIKKAAATLFKTASEGGKKLTRNSWDVFWAKRWEWSTTGATNMPYPEFSQGLEYPSWNAKTKFLTYLQMPNELTIDDIIKYQPAIVAKPSTKYEWGKTRAIYGCDDLSHLIYTFVMGTPEEMLPHWVPLGRSSNEQYVTKLYSTVAAEGYPLCLDFEDFNSQHSVESMREVLEAYFEIFGHMLTDDQRKFIPWILDSINLQIVMGSGAQEETYQTKGTLFSGWRLTTFMNTVLNYCYTQVIVTEAQGISYGSLHSGDDVFMTVGSGEDYIKMCFSASDHNIRLSTTKCFFGTIQEFLRKDRKHGEGAQYLARGVSTLVHGRTESVQHSDIIEMLKSNECRINEIYNRGGDLEMLDELRDVYIKHMRTKREFSGLTDELVSAIYNSHPVNKGINLEVGATSVDIDLEKSTKGSLTGIHLPGVSAYSDLLIKYVREGKDLTRLRRAVYAATERVCFSTMTRVVGLRNVDLHERRCMRALYKMYSKVKTDIHYGKVRLVGLDCVSRDLLDNISVLDKVIGNKENYYEWLSVLV